MRLLSNRVLVKLAPVPETTASGLILAEAMPAPAHYGKVVQVGPSCRAVQPGHVVFLSPEAIAEDATGYDGLLTPHVIVRETELELRMEA